MPSLAESWIVEDGGLRYTFHLRDDVHFHDGTPLSAAAVVASLERVLSPDRVGDCIAETYLLQILGAREYRAGRADDGIDYDFHGENYTTVYLAEGENGRGKELVGYMVELGIYTGDHDVDQMLYFNRKGQYLGNEYHGE